MTMGMFIVDYPCDLTQYLHHGRRSELWDQEAQEGLKLRMQGQRVPAAARLAKALEKGANDPLLLICAMCYYLDTGDPEHALTLWKGNAGQIDSKLYGGKFTKIPTEALSFF